MFQAPRTREIPSYKFQDPGEQIEDEDKDENEENPPSPGYGAANRGKKMEGEA